MNDDLDTEVHSRTPINNQESETQLRARARIDPKKSQPSWRSQANNSEPPNNSLDVDFSNLQLSNRNNSCRLSSSSESRYKTKAASSDEQLSGSLFFALKNPQALGLSTINNFLNLSDILRHRTLIGKKYTFEHVERVVANCNDKHFGRFKLLKHDDRNWSIGLIEFRRFEQENNHFVTNDPMHKVLFEVLERELGLTNTDSIDSNDLLKIPAISQAQIKLEDIERLLSNTDDPFCKKYIFLCYESGLCLIKKNDYFTTAERKVKFQYYEKWYSDRHAAIDKALTFHLRHNSGLADMADDGFVDSDVILRFPQMKKLNCTIEDLKLIWSVQETHSYPRYHKIVNGKNRYKIKATHGHSIPRVMAWNWANWECETKLPILAHRCNYSTWATVRHNGFEKSKHKTFNFNDPENKEIKSSREVEIWIDAAAARKDGVLFYKVEGNQMITSEGLADGLPLKYFVKVFDRTTGEVIKVKSLQNRSLLHLTGRHFENVAIQKLANKNKMPSLKC